jgi:hypothetical protein
LRAFPLLLLLAACVDAPTAPPARALTSEAPSLAPGLRRTWTGAVSTDWSIAENWSPRGVPAVQDSVLVPAGTPLFPTLTGNAAVARVMVESGGSLDLGGFDLTCTGSVFTGLTGGITGTGYLVLTGTAATVRGRLPRMRVTGTYSLAGDVLARSPVDVDRGRITDAGWRLDAQPF